MSNKKVKGAMAAALAGTMLAGGCLGGSLPWQQILWGSAVYAGLEFVTDSDGIFDLFEDGEPTPAAAPAN
jgi:hypothetical protein